MISWLSWYITFVVNLHYKTRKGCQKKLFKIIFSKIFFSETPYGFYNANYLKKLYIIRIGRSWGKFWAIKCQKWFKIKLNLQNFYFLARKSQLSGTVSRPLWVYHLKLMVLNVGSLIALAWKKFYWKNISSNDR